MKTSNNSCRKKGFITLVIVLSSVTVFLLAGAYILKKYHSTLDYFDNVEYVSTFDCPDNIEFDKLKQWFCPDTVDWDNYDKNYPCYVSDIKYHGQKCFYDSKSKLTNAVQLDTWLQFRTVSMVEYNCFKVRANLHEYMYGELKTTLLEINTVDWNVTHPRAERFQDLVIKDFPLKEVIGYVYNGYKQPGLYFFFDIDDENLLLYYYKDIESFIFSNIGKLYLNYEHLKSDFGEWLACLPLENVDRKWKRLLSIISSEIGNSQFYKMKIKKSEFLKYCN